MNFSKSSIFTAVFLSISMAGIAQQRNDTTIKDQHINIYREYVPEVYLPAKPVLKPSDIRLDDVKTPIMEYNVPPQTLQYNYGAISLRPLALQPEADKMPYQNYAALGLGNYSTLLADFGLTYHEEGKYDAIIHGYHFSQKGGKIADRQSSLTNITVGGKYFLPKYVLQGNVQYQRRGMTYYGYNHFNYDFDKADILQAYNTVEANLGLAQFSVTEHALGIQPSIQAYTHNAKIGGTEYGFGWQVPVSYAITEELHASVGVNGMVTNFVYDDAINQNNNYFQLTPQITYSKNKLWLQAGISPTKATKSDWTILPNIKARYAIGALSRAAISAGWDDDVIMYTYKNLTEKNPFVRIPSVGNAYRNRIYAGLELSPMSNLKIEGKVSYNRFNRFSTYTNDYDYHLAGNFFTNTWVNKLEVFQTYVAAHVLISNQFDLGAHVQFNSFSRTTVPVLHEPKMELGAYLKVKPIQKLSFGANLNFLSGIQYYNISNEKKTVNAAFDLGLHAQYEFLERFEVFLNLDNMMDSKYQRWNQYPVYGLNIFGGLKVKF